LFIQELLVFNNSFCRRYFANVPVGIKTSPSHEILLTDSLVGDNHFANMALVGGALILNLVILHMFSKLWMR